MPEVYLFSGWIPRPVVAHTQLSDLLGSSSDRGFVPGAPPPDSLTIPCVCFVCRNCGDVGFFNVHVLGLADALGIPRAGKPIA
jgi:hypothetical protein